MAAFYDDRAKNLMLDALAAAVTRVALHTGDPGAADTAANEVAGGSPAYARKAISFVASSAGVLGQNGDVVLDVPGGTSVTWISYWNTAGTQRFGKKLVTTEVFGAQGTYAALDASSFNLNNDP